MEATEVLFVLAIIAGGAEAVLRRSLVGAAVAFLAAAHLVR